MTDICRRTFVRGTAVSGMTLAVSAALASGARAQDPTTTLAPDAGGGRGDGPYGPLGADPDANGLLLPAGFTSRAIAVSGEPVAGTEHPWHPFPDGGACFATDDGGWIYVSNAEAPNDAGGVSAVRFDAAGEITDAYAILSGTNINCAGGLTPWGTWLSCEEFDWHGADPALAEASGSIAGQVWECDPTQPGQGTALPALGLFQHEAAAVDPEGQRVYLTEDKSDGRLYRFTPDAYPDLTAGTLEAALVGDDGTVTWVEVPDPSAAETRTAEQVADDTTAFPGGEGIWFYDGTVVFTTKGDNRVHRLDTSDDRYEIIYDAADQGDDPTLTGVDNITVDEGSGDLVVAEDGGNMELVLLTPEGGVNPLLRVVGHDNSELTGPAFSPDGTRLYVSSQRGEGSSLVGVTWEITGPFRGAANLDTGGTTSVPSPSTTIAAAGEAAGPADEDDDGLSPLLLGGGVALAAGAVAAGVVALRKRGESDVT